ncbi:MAG: acyltransferase [bacterium]
MGAKKELIKTYDIVNLLIAFFVFIILYLHHRVYVAIYDNFKNPSIFDIFLVRIAVGGFFFLSGYKLTKTKLADSFVEFWKNRILRIYPLYFFSLALFTFIVYPPSNNGLYPTISNFFIHALGLQVLFPNLFGNNYSTLYFVGLLFLYYFLFLIIKNRIKSADNFLIASMLIFTICFAINQVALKFSFLLFHILFFIYFYFFVFGMYFSHYETDAIEYINKRSNRFFLLVLSFVAAFIYLILLIEKNFQNSYYEILPILFATIPVYIFFLSSNIVFSKKIGKMLKKISYASFATYLFHRPIWTIMCYFWHDNFFGQWVYMTPIGVGIIFFISYGLQRGYDFILK